jgi:hypothetical protein
MVPGALSPSHDNADEPQDEQNSGNDPKNVKSETKPGKENYHKERKRQQHPVPF